MPLHIRKALLSKYMYADISLGYESGADDDPDFVYAMYRGLKPRRFSTNELIIEENQPAEEMYFIQTGAIGIGFSRLTFYHEKEGPYIFKVRLG